MKGDPPLVINFDDLPSKRRFVSDIGGLRGVWELTIERPRTPRTRKSNRYYFVAVCGLWLHRARELYGDPSITSTEAHNFLKIQILGLTDRVDKETGEVVRFIPETHNMEQTDFNNYIESCAKWLAEKHGIVVMSSEEYWQKQEKRTA